MAGREQEDKLLQIQPNIAQINLRTISSSCHSSLNKHALDYSRNGLLAYASHGVINVLDPKALKIVQTLDREHKASVTRLKWSKAWSKRHVSHEMMLASADASGRILIWNVKSGEVKTQLSEQSKLIQAMAWLDEAIEDTGHLLLVIHAPNVLVLWDALSGKKVWAKTFTESTLLTFDLDPFDISRLALKATDCILFINDFHPSKPPNSCGKRLYVSGPVQSTIPRQSPSRHSMAESVAADQDSSAKISRLRIKKMMKDFVLGNETSNREQAIAAISECQQVLFHRNARNHLVLVYRREVLILDLDIGQTVGMVALDRSCSPIVKLIPCKLRDGFLILLENGAVTFRLRKNLFSVAATPMNASSFLSRSISSSSVNNQADNVSDIFNPSTLSTEIQYEQKAVSEAIRLSKHAKALSFALNPVTETSAVLLSSDGKVFILEMQIQGSGAKKKKSHFYQMPCISLEDQIPPSSVEGASKDLNIKLVMNGVFANLANSPFVLKMCPPLTTKNWPDYQPLLASGGNNGNIQILNMSTGTVERDFATHTFPIRGIEWTSLHSLLSHAHQSLSGASSNLVRNELNHTDIRTGKSVALRSNRSEEPSIDMIRVSHLKQFFIVSFRGAPFELWDLKNLSLLRTMPKKFPPITALEWSPLHNLKSLKKRQEESLEKRESEDHPQALIAKEHFVFTDPEGQLYHFSVEGNAIRDGTKVPAEGNLATITCISWKSEVIVRADTEGNLNIWDVKTKSSRNISTKRGFIKKIRFAPGRGNMKLLVLHVDTVSIWDVKEAEVINELRSPKDLVSKPIDIEWAASDRPVVASSDGSIRILSLALSLSTSSGPLEATNLTIPCFGLLPNKLKQNITMMLHHQPWNDDFSLEPDGGLSTSESKLFTDFIKLLDPEYMKYLSNTKLSALERCRVASKVCHASQFEMDFWTLASVVLDPSSQLSLDTRFDLTSDCASYLRYQLERLHLHESKIGDGELRRRVIDQMLCLGLKEEAVALLLESESQTNPHHYEDSLRACLVSSCQGAVSNPNNTTIKLVATNMIAEGKLWEGVELLCLTDKVYDACKYLQSDQHWDSSLWLAKCRLGNSSHGKEEFAKVLAKYCDHCVATHQAKRAILVQLGQRDYVTVLDLLINAKMIALAAMFLQILEETKEFPDTSHGLVLSEEISLAYAQRLYDSGNNKASYHYCDKADEKGGMLRKELEALDGRNVEE